MRLFFILGLGSLGCMAEEAPACSQVLQFAEGKLPHSGRLSQTSTFVYVEVSNDYIYKLLPFIQQEGYEAPPYFGPDLVGAHITVIYPDEVVKHGIGQIEECGQEIAFKVIDCEIVTPPKWNFDKAYLVEVDAPEIDRIRKKYGLPKREYSAHITVGVKPKQLSKTAF